MKYRIALTAVTTAVLLVTWTADHARAMGETAAAALKFVDGSDAGSIKLTQTPAGALLKIDLKGLKPVSTGCRCIRLAMVTATSRRPAPSTTRSTPSTAFSMMKVRWQAIYRTSTLQRTGPERPPRSRRSQQDQRQPLPDRGGCGRPGQQVRHPAHRGARPASSRRAATSPPARRLPGRPPGSRAGAEHPAAAGNRPGTVPTGPGSRLARAR